jgi:hypothetical protein
MAPTVKRLTTAVAVAEVPEVVGLAQMRSIVWAPTEPRILAATAERDSLARRKGQPPLAVCAAVAEAAQGEVIVRIKPVEMALMDEYVSLGIKILIGNRLLAKITRIH